MAPVFNDPKFKNKLLIESKQIEIFQNLFSDYFFFVEFPMYLEK